MVATERVVALLNQLMALERETLADLQEDLQEAISRQDVEGQMQTTHRIVLTTGRLSAFYEMLGFVKLGAVEGLTAGEDE